MYLILVLIVVAMLITWRLGLFLILVGFNCLKNLTITEPLSNTEKIYDYLGTLKEPVELSPHLLLKMKKKLKIDSLKISECIYILERKDQLHKLPVDNKRCLVLKDLQTVDAFEGAVTIIITDGKLYLKESGLKDKWTTHDDWILKLS
jgi:hypothetical protein